VKALKNIYEKNPKLGENSDIFDENYEKHVNTVTLGTLGRGGFFGEIGLLYDIDRQVSVETMESCLFLTLSKPNFKSFLEIAPELIGSLSINLGNRVTVLLEKIKLNIKIKENKPWSKLNLLGEMGQLKQWREKEIIYNEGEKGDYFYIILDGAVQYRQREKDKEKHIENGQNEHKGDGHNEEREKGENGDDEERDTDLHNLSTSPFSSNHSSPSLSPMSPPFSISPSRSSISLSPSLSTFGNIKRKSRANSLIINNPALNKSMNINNLAGPNTHIANVTNIANMTNTFNISSHNNNHDNINISNSSQSTPSLSPLSPSTPLSPPPIVSLLSSGDYFGEDCLSLRGEREATAITISPVTVLSLSRHNLLKYLSIVPEFKEILVKKTHFAQLSPSEASSFINLDQNSNSFIAKKASDHFSHSPVSEKPDKRHSIHTLSTPISHRPSITSTSHHSLSPSVSPRPSLSLSISPSISPRLSNNRLSTNSPTKQRDPSPYNHDEQHYTQNMNNMSSIANMGNIGAHPNMNIHYNTHHHLINNMENNNKNIEKLKKIENFEKYFNNSSINRNSLTSSTLSPPMSPSISPLPHSISSISPAPSISPPSASPIPSLSPVPTLSHHRSLSSSLSPSPQQSPHQSPYLSPNRFAISFFPPSPNSNSSTLSDQSSFSESVNQTNTNTM
jgi:CRP-like cAMP-binding protein